MKKKEEPSAHSRRGDSWVQVDLPLADDERQPDSKFTAPAQPWGALGGPGGVALTRFVGVASRIR